MASVGANGSKSRLAQLWQAPLLILSLGLFVVAGALLIPRKKSLTLDQQIDHQEGSIPRDPAQVLTNLKVLRETTRLTKEQNARLHLLQARALQNSRPASDLEPAANRGVIEHLKLALSNGAPPTPDIYRRLAESSAVIGKSRDAYDNFRLQLALDPVKPLALQRKIIGLQLAKNDDEGAEQGLKEYEKDSRTPGGDRAWAKAELSRIEVDRGNFKEASDLLEEALTLDTDTAVQGRVNYRKGYCENKLGHVDEAERLLRVARDQLKGRSAEADAEAAQLLGRILQDKNKPQEALSFYEDVIRNYPDSPVAPLAKLGRGVCRTQITEDEPGILDLTDSVRFVESKPEREKLKADVLVALRRSSGQLASHGNLHGALEVMELEQTLTPEPAADFFARLASVYDKRSEEIQKTLDTAPTDIERQHRQEEQRQMLVRSGDARMSFARAVILSDDKAAGEELWKAIDRYDKAGDLDRTISGLELFASERPSDSRAPDALLKLGLSCRAAGLFDKAIKAFRDIQFRYPQSLAVSRSGVPLAQAYLAKGPEFYGKAETALQLTLDSDLITPEAEDFKEALFALANLYYRTDRYEAAVARLEELNERYPTQERMGQVLFLMADSYRKSAGLLKNGKAPTTNPTISPVRTTRAEIAAARRERLEKARVLYDRLVDFYKDNPPTTDVDKLYLKLAFLYRADCHYDNGNFEEAIRMYDAAALRYQDDPWALAAYVQIVNSYLALGRPLDAKTANERAKWLLRRMPAGSFKDEQFSIPRKYWDDWLTWSGNAGMW